MTLTAQDFDDCVMAADAMFKQWLVDFEEEYEGERERQAMAIALASMSPQELQQLLVMSMNPAYVANNAANNALVGG